jgi:NADH-quinone oxidoreductase subunit H
MFFYWVIMWIKYSVPRIRIDHMLAFNWKFLVPLALVVLVNAAVLDKLLSGYSYWIYVLGMFASNIIIGFITVEILRAVGRKQSGLGQNPTLKIAPDGEAGTDSGNST